MDFFGIGPLEIILILVVLLIVVGPTRLPEIAAALGRGMRKFRQATMELSKDFKEMAEEVKDTGKEVGTALDPNTGLAKDFKEMAEEVEATGKEAGAALDPTTGLSKDFKDMTEEVKDVGKEVGTALDPAPEKVTEPRGEETKT